MNVLLIVAGVSIALVPLVYVEQAELGAEDGHRTDNIWDSNASFLFCHIHVYNEILKIIN